MANDRSTKHTSHRLVHRAFLLVSLAVAAIALPLEAQRTVPGADAQHTKEPTEVPRVLLDTDAGQVTVELYASQALVSVANFLRYVSEKRYDGAVFYRAVTLSNQPGNAVKIEVIQGGIDGDPTRRLPAIVHETTQATGLTHSDGTLSMARAAVGTASSEFFITIGDQSSLDFGGARNADGQGFAAFGRVVSGMDIVRAIQRMPADSAPPQRLHTLVRIRSARLLR